LYGPATADGNATAKALGSPDVVAAKGGPGWCVEKSIVDAANTTTTSPPTTTTTYNPTLVISVTGTGSSLSSVTIDQSGQETQHTEVGLPYSLTIPDPGYGPASDTVMNAQTADGSANASVTCSINDPTGGVLDTNTSTGPYAVVSCQFHG
jgi:hypothetical protein